MTQSHFSIDDLKKFLKFRLPTWKNKEYWDWCNSKRIDGYEWHHLLERKYYDCLLVRIPKAQHDRIHHGTGYNDGEFQTLFIEAMMWLMEFINYKTEK